MLGTPCKLKNVNNNSEKITENHPSCVKSNQNYYEKKSELRKGQSKLNYEKKSELRKEQFKAVYTKTSEKRKERSKSQYAKNTTKQKNR